MNPTKTKSSAPEATKPAASADPTIIRILTALPVALNGEVYTFVDVAKHNATMAIETYGVRVKTKSMPSKQGRDFLVPWSNVTGILYPPPPPLDRNDPYGRPLGQQGATN